jgi:hypothetical protein
MSNTTVPCSKCKKIISLVYEYVPHGGLCLQCETELHPKNPINWNYYICRGCNEYGDSHMISLQARLELCDVCYFTLPKTWKVERGEHQ